MRIEDNPDEGDYYYYNYINFIIIILYLIGNSEVLDSLVLELNMTPIKVIIKIILFFYILNSSFPY